MSRVAFGLVLGCFTAVGVLPQTDDTRLVLQPPSIVWIEAGMFVMGADLRDLEYAVDLCRRSRPADFASILAAGACSPARFDMERPRRRVWTASYGIDRTEVTHAAWRTCVIEGRCPPSRIRGDDERLASSSMPVAGVTWYEARNYCEFAGGRLPSDAEWERAARGSERWRRFPWGRQYNSRLANHGRSPRGPDGDDGAVLVAPVGSFPSGASPYGLLDVAGNVWEWIRDPPPDGLVTAGTDASVYRIIRGGSWMQPPEALRVTHRAWQLATSHHADVGLRCAYDRSGLAVRGSSAILRRP